MSRPPFVCFALPCTALVCIEILHTTQTVLVASPFHPLRSLKYLMPFKRYLLLVHFSHPRLPTRPVLMFFFFKIFIDFHSFSLIFVATSRPGLPQATCKSARPPRHPEWVGLLTSFVFIAPRELPSPLKHENASLQTCFPESAAPFCAPRGWVYSLRSYLLLLRPCITSQAQECFASNVLSGIRRAASAGSSLAGVLDQRVANTSKEA